MGIAGLAVLGGLAVLVLSGITALVWSSIRSERDQRPVLPSHYTAVFESGTGNRSRVCGECGTANPPEDTYCKRCGADLLEDGDPVA